MFVELKQLVAWLEGEDRETLPAGDGGEGSCRRYPVPEDLWDKTEEEIFDWFHATIPLACVEDFDWKIVETPESAASLVSRVCRDAIASGSSECAAVGDCLQTIAENGDEQAEPSYLAMCAGEIAMHAEAIRQALLRRSRTQSEEEEEEATTSAFTVAILIGNSDDKLTQVEWVSYINEINYLIDRYAEKLYFSGYSAPTSPWQNACRVVLVSGSQQVEDLRNELKVVAGTYRQDSIALVVGKSELVASRPPSPMQQLDTALQDILRHRLLCWDAGTKAERLLKTHYQQDKDVPTTSDLIDYHLSGYTSATEIATLSGESLRRLFEIQLPQD